MSVKDYFDHYISFPDSLKFLGLAVSGIILVNLILLGFAKISAAHYKPAEGEDEDTGKLVYSCGKFREYTQKCYEVFFAGNSILFFMAVYYLIDRFFTLQPYKSILVKYNGFLLLLLIVFSCIINSLLDRVLIRLSYLRRDDISAVRFTGMFYMALIFCYIKYIYENDNYDSFITYFLGLMIGRFVYFDASFRDFIHTLGGGIRNIPFMLLSLSVTALMAFYGFKTEFLIKHIGVVTNTYIAHIFICTAIFIIFHIHPERIFFGKAACMACDKRQNV